MIINHVSQFNESFPCYTWFPLTPIGIKGKSCVSTALNLEATLALTYHRLVSLKEHFADFHDHVISPHCSAVSSFTIWCRSFRRWPCRGTTSLGSWNNVISVYLHDLRCGMISPRFQVGYDCGRLVKLEGRKRRFLHTEPTLFQDIIDWTTTPLPPSARGLKCHSGGV